MFCVIEIKDVIRLKPKRFATDRNEALAFEINKMFTNKVIHKRGLGICLFDLLDIGDGEIHPSDGAAHVHVTFRLLMFRPFVGEVLKGTIRSCSRDSGIRVSLGTFFDDVVIPPDKLRPGSFFDEAKQTWIWRYSADDAVHDLEYSLEDEIYFMVDEEIFTDIPPRTRLESKKAAEETAAQQVPYLIKAKADLDGLGMCEWWDL
ncbi:hypothetical protein PTSG_05411 [Salpingoeca rosetta]|uniref:DNA-directed RNA polymerase III subunit RPC8 n=1 Tax=Salpingoeca rosetta (strain ATCC 50818 / BSB-021) TaxID=946362 RepID=F2UAC9_SALR5|nr:uncharacterized protein PTSG_05411 [Salpingoeca rosetta]EGD73704.1 hypothetical protein PTSG_05411 [Salpingoeca rosetta]|eukprot:XP_004993985.1 hypothetical protein PTSG_05411 [Salpingoeca rosetta]